jgi:hypothetical protein
MWRKFATHWRRAVQRMALFRSKRRLDFARTLRSMSLRQLAAFHCDTFRSRRELAVPTAISHVNSILMISRFPAITKLDELSKYSDVPHCSIPAFPHTDYAFACLVNQMLRGRPIPEPIESALGTRHSSLDLDADDLAELTGHIDLDGSLTTFTKPQVNALAAISTVGVTLFVTDNLAEGMLQQFLRTVRYPLERNTVSMAVVDKLVGRMKFDDLDDFSLLDLRSLPEFSLVDPRRFVNSRLSGSVVDQLLIESALPIIPNVVTRDVIQEIGVDADLVRSCFENFGKFAASFRPICQYQLRDEQLFVNDKVAGDLLASSFQVLDLPLTPNVVNDRVIDRIVLPDVQSALDFRETITSTSIRGLVELSRRVTANSTECVDDLFSAYLATELNRLPLGANAIDADAVREIAAGDFGDSLSQLGRDHSAALVRYTGKDVHVYVHQGVKKLVDELLSELNVPVVANDMREDVVDDILQVFEFWNLDRFSQVSLRGLHCEPKESLFYANDQRISAVRDQLIDELRLPLCANEVDLATIAEIADEPLIDSIIPITTLNVKALNCFELDDSDISTSDFQIWKIIDRILNEFDDDVPVGPNALAVADIGDIVRHFRFFEVSGVVDISPFDAINPVERRIDFGHQGLSQSFVTSELDSLPLSANVCRDDVAQQILHRLEPLDFFGFQLAGTLPLACYEAPEEVIELLDTVADRLIGLIMDYDILPCVPIWEEVPDDVAEEIAQNFFAEKGALESVVGYAVCGIEPLAMITRNDIPRIITPDDVVEYELGQYVLPAMPILGPVSDLGDDWEAIGPVDPGTMLTADGIEDPAVLAMLQQYTKGPLRH